MRDFVRLLSVKLSSIDMVRKYPILNTPLDFRRDSGGDWYFLFLLLYYKETLNYKLFVADRLPKMIKHWILTVDMSNLITLNTTVIDYKSQNMQSIHSRNSEIPKCETKSRLFII